MYPSLIYSGFMQAVSFVSPPAQTAVQLEDLVEKDINWENSQLSSPPPQPTAAPDGSHFIIYFYLCSPPGDHTGCVWCTRHIYTNKVTWFEMGDSGELERNCVWASHPRPFKVKLIKVLAWDQIKVCVSWGYIRQTPTQLCTHFPGPHVHLCLQQQLNLSL